MAHLKSLTQSCVHARSYAFTAKLQAHALAQNISAPFICEVPPFKAALTAALKKADFLFGNETEAAAFAKSEGWEETDVAKIAAKIAAIPGEKPRTVVRRPPALTTRNVVPHVWRPF